MTRKGSVFAGLALIGLGLLAMASTVGAPLFGLHLLRFSLWRFWPLTVVSVGMGFVLPPFLYRGRRGLGGLFIPGVPILVTGGVLLFTSVLNWWSAWSWLWPLEVLSVAAGFVLAALYMRVIWLLIPAIILGANGLLFQFCAITNLWEVWAVMWTIEPLSVGLALLLIGARKRLSGLMLAGMLLCGIGGVGMMGMMAILSTSWILSGWFWVFRMVGPSMIILVGVLLLLWGMAHRTQFFKMADN
jgi:hypothetical protein